MGKNLSRRRMLARTLTAGAGAWIAGEGLLSARPPADKLRIAIVGCGGQGGENLRRVSGEAIVALCDVDDRQAAGAFKAHPQAKKFRDWRKMLDAVHKEIDAVVVSTPDHMHAAVSLAAMRLGKHVYCEKPLTWSIEEARLMAKVAKEAKVATQMGTQGLACDGARMGIETIRAGFLGEVKELHVWTDRAEGWWPQGIDRPAQGQPPPPEIDWDLWLGVAPERPYHEAYCPFRWRGWKDFGTGAVGDMGIHNAAMPWIALELGRPRSAEIIATSGLKAETFPAWATLKLEFPPRGKRGPVTMFWYDGGKRPSRDLLGGEEPAKNGAIVVGKNMTLYSVEWTGGDWSLRRGKQVQDEISWREPTLPLTGADEKGLDDAHRREWIEAAKGGRPAFCNFVDFAADMTEAMLVAALAIRTGKKIEWDAEAMKAAGCPEADPFIRREYRKGWKV
jgi:predicted dehydrogenase